MPKLQSVDDTYGPAVYEVDYYQVEKHAAEMRKVGLDYNLHESWSLDSDGNEYVQFADDDGIVQLVEVTPGTIKDGLVVELK